MKGRTTGDPEERGKVYVKVAIEARQEKAAIAKGSAGKGATVLGPREVRVDTARLDSALKVGIPEKEPVSTELRARIKAKTGIVAISQEASMAMVNERRGRADTRNAATNQAMPDREPRTKPATRLTEGGDRNTIYKQLIS